MVATPKPVPEPREAHLPQSPLRSTLAARRAQQRAERQQRFRARGHRALPERLREADPLVRRGAGPARQALVAAALLLGSLALHTLPVLVAGGMRAWLPSWQPEKRPSAQRLQVAVVERPRPPPLAEPEPEPEPKPEPIRVAATKPAPPKPPPAAPKARQEPAPPPQADPIDLQPPGSPEPAEATPPSRPPRRVVGLSFESTVSGGRGPAMAVGNTRMGRSDSTATAPDSVGKLTPNALSRNRRATRVGPGRTRVVPPRRLSSAPPPYPEQLRQKGLEADVVVVVMVDERGAVRTVDVVKPASQQAFNEAAQRAAREERFAPATRNAQPVPYSLRYTYRFRLNET